MPMIIGTGIEIAFATSAFSAEIIDVTPPNRSRKSVDVTHQSAAAMLYIPGKLVEGGELKLKIGFNPATAAPIDGAVEVVSITFPDSAGTIWTFDGFMTGYNPTGTLEDKMTADVTVKVAGAITQN